MPHINSQITKTLPRSAWKDVVIKENNEPLVEVLETDRIKIVNLFQSNYDPIYFVRKTIAEKMIEVSNGLPEGINLVLIEGYRTLKNQEDSWNKLSAKIKLENPNLSNEQIEDKVKLVIARPNPLANHHCGGAIDVTLCYKDGEMLDMGTSYPSEPASTEIQNKYPMFCEGINEKQIENRKILRDAMVSSGFVWYPGEWRHYCYGDRMWAVYTNSVECFYGPIDLIS